MTPTETWMAALVRSRNVPGPHIENPLDTDTDDDWTSVKADFGGSLKDSIIVTRERTSGTHDKKMAMLDWEGPKPPKFLKLRVFWARLLRW